MRRSCFMEHRTSILTPSVGKASTLDSAANPQEPSTVKEATLQRVPSLQIATRTGVETRRCFWCVCWLGTTPRVTAPWCDPPTKPPPTHLICMTLVWMTWATPISLSYLHLIRYTQNMSLSTDPKLQVCWEEKRLSNTKFRNPWLFTLILITMWMPRTGKLPNIKSIVYKFICSNISWSIVRNVLRHRCIYM